MTWSNTHHLHFQHCVFCKTNILPLSSCLLFELCSRLSGRCRCLLEESRRELHSLPKHLQLSHSEEVQVGLTIRGKTVSRQLSLTSCFLTVWSVHSPTICMSIIAVSTWFSTCTVISYFPEWLRSALRMKMMLSQSVLRMLTCEGSIALPSFSQVTFGLGLPCRHHTGFINLLRDSVHFDPLGHCFTINGTTRLTASPTLRVYVCFKCRGTRIFGGSE